MSQQQRVQKIDSVILEDLDEDFNYFSNQIESNMNEESLMEYYFSLAELISIQIDNYSLNKKEFEMKVSDAKVFLENSVINAKSLNLLSLMPFIQDLEDKFKAIYPDFYKLK